MIMRKQRVNQTEYIHEHCDHDLPIGVEDKARRPYRIPAYEVYLAGEFTSTGPSTDTDGEGSPS
jgi:hypothetical protein